VNRTRTSATSIHPDDAKEGARFYVSISLIRVLITVKLTYYRNSQNQTFVASSSASPTQASSTGIPTLGTSTGSPSSTTSPVKPSGAGLSTEPGLLAAVVCLIFAIITIN
jgi:hypothetical protein